MKFLALINREQIRLCCKKDCSDIIKLSGVIVNDTVFDYEYNNVKLLIEEVFNCYNNDISSCRDTIAEFNIDMNIPECWVSNDIVIDNCYDRFIALYYIQRLGEYCKIYRTYEKFGSVNTLFDKEYDYRWYKSVLDNRIKGVNIVRACWSGSPPVLCNGIWYLEVNGKDVSNNIPNRYYQQNTYLEVRDGSYCELEGCPSGHSSCDGCDGYYKCGLKRDEWIEDNIDWLKNISDNYEVYNKIYDAINENDFIAGTCGGCS